MVQVKYIGYCRRKEKEAVWQHYDGVSWKPYPLSNELEIVFQEYIKPGELKPNKICIFGPVKVQHWVDCYRTEKDGERND